MMIIILYVYFTNPNIKIKYNCIASINDIKPNPIFSTVRLVNLYITKIQNYSELNPKFYLTQNFQKIM